MSSRSVHCHSYLATTSPEDVARVEKQTFVCTTRKEDAVPTPAPGVESMLGNWKEPLEMDKEMEEKFRGSMTGEYIPITSMATNCLQTLWEI